MQKWDERFRLITKARGENDKPHDSITRYI